MKKILALMLVLLVVSAGIFCGVGIAVNAKKDQVTITENIMYGDKPAASGITIKSKSHYDKHLFWDTTYTVGEPSLYNTEYSFSASEQGMSGTYKYMGIVLETDIAYGCDFELPAEEQQGIGRAYKELYDAAKPGEEAKRLIRLKDYYEYYPIGIEINLPNTFWHVYAQQYLIDELNDYKYAWQIFNEFFKIPVLANESLEISVSKDNGGGMSVGIGSSTADSEIFFMSARSAYTDDRCFFTINNRTSEGNIVDTSLIPGGYGIYAFSYGKEAKKYKTGIDADSLKMVYPLDEKVIVTHLTMSYDKSRLLLFTNESEEMYMTVIDAGTMHELQKISIVEGVLYEVYEYEDFIVIYSSESRISLLAVNEEDEYEYKFTVDTADKVNPDFSSYWTNPSFNFDGEKLVAVDYMYVGEYRSVPSCDYFMAVYCESGLLYYAEYYSSLSVHPYLNKYRANCMLYDYNWGNKFTIEFEK